MRDNLVRFDLCHKCRREIALVRLATGAIMPCEVGKKPMTDGRMMVSITGRMTMRVRRGAKIGREVHWGSCRGGDQSANS